MQAIIAGGTGLIGQRLINHWLAQNHEIKIITRTPQKVARIFGTDIPTIKWNDLTSETFESANVVVNLAGTNVGDKRWSKKRKDDILNSRVQSAKKISRLLMKLSEPPHLLNASAVGIYGPQASVEGRMPPSLDESATIDNEAKDFLSTVCQELEKVTEPAIAAGVPITFLRFGVVLAKEGGALPKLVTPFKYYLGGPIGSGLQPISWIAIDDVISAIDFIIQHKITGPINIVAPIAVQQAQFASTIAKVLHQPDVIRMPEWLISFLFGEMGRELLLNGQRVYPARLVNEGFVFSYPDLEAALKHLLKETQSSSPQ